MAFDYPTAAALRAQLQARLQTHLQYLSRDRNPDFAPVGHFFAQQYLQQELGRFAAVEAFEFQYRSRTHHNWLINLPGLQPHRPPILIGAHYDTVPGSPGADDNASGVAVLIELARALAAQPARCPVRLVGFDLEEYGFVGSAAYAAKLQQHGQPLTLMLSLEMLGYYDLSPGSQTYPPGLKHIYPNRGHFIALVGTLPTLPGMVRLWWHCRQAGIPCQWLPALRQGQMVPDSRRSDHAPFWDAGYPAIMVTDTANLRNPHYHQPSDTPATLNVEMMARLCQGLASGLRKL